MGLEEIETLKEELAQLRQAYVLRGIATFESAQIVRSLYYKKIKEHEKYIGEYNKLLDDLRLAYSNHAELQSIIDKSESK